MTWKPAHGAHAIDRVRVLVNFDDPIPDKLLQRAAGETTGRFEDLGFDSLSRADSSILNIILSGQAARTPQEPKNGWVLKRGGIVEEAGFRDGVFGYVTAEYGRWENLVSRFTDIFSAPLNLALQSVYVETVKLEYLDRFIFDGPADQADTSKLLPEVDPAINSDATAGSSVWHSYVGWFEQMLDGKALINRNFDIVEEEIDGKIRRVAKIRTMTDYRPASKIDDIDHIYVALDELHRRSLLLLGSSISSEAQEQIGMDLEDYKA